MGEGRNKRRVAEWRAQLYQVPIDLRARLRGRKADVWLVCMLAAALYLCGVWAHYPYGGGHVYSDLVTVFQNRLDSSSFSINNLPYVNTFIEYPPLTSYVIYLAGVMGALLPLNPTLGLLDNYYLYSSLLLSIPTFLMIPELLKICRILGLGRGPRRVQLFYVATPSFVLMVLLNWYIIGVYFATLGLRKYLEGSRRAGAVLFGVSAGSNLVTAAPALGLFIAADGWRERMNLTATALGTYALINAPFVIINRSLWLAFWKFEENWYIEGSWMLAFLNNESPLRHYIFPALFVGLCVAIVFSYRKRLRRSETRRDRRLLGVKVAALVTSAYLLSTYVFTPQMNLILLPFFVLVPFTRRRWEFYAFETVNALIILYGFSAPLLTLGIHLPTPVQFGPIWQSPVQALAVIRSLWLGKFLIYDGLVKPEIFPSLEKPVSVQTRLDIDWLSPRVRQESRYTYPDGSTDET